MSAEIVSLLSKPRRGGKRRAFICDLCHQRAMLKPGRHWCGCNPSAPFQMVDVWIAFQASAAAEALTGLVSKWKRGNK